MFVADRRGGRLLCGEVRRQLNLWAMNLRHGSLFSGIGGFDLAASWMGWENVFQCEIDPFCQKVLKYHFPDAIQYEDIKQTDFTIWRGKIDVLTGGFPCQPFSRAGKRKGTEDDRHLWPEMLRVIREIQPRWVVGENVFGIVNWSKGLVFEQVLSDLEAEGYEVQPYVLPAVSKDAPHRRDRVWFVANSDHTRTRNTLRDHKNGTQENKGWDGQSRSEFRKDSKSIANTNGGQRSKRGMYAQKPKKAERYTSPCNSRDVINTQSERLEERDAEQTQQRPHTAIKRYNSIPNWQDFPTQPPVCSRNDGIPGELAGITFSKWRIESIKAYGNAIVPQVALQIFKSIQDYELSTRHT